VIICLGESIIAIGAASHELNTAHVAVVALSLMITVGMWWTYFDRFAATAEARLPSPIGWAFRHNRPRIVNTTVPRRPEMRG
jgi:low temperature requirement protein LtrA